MRIVNIEVETIVPNDGKTLVDALELDAGTLQHTGNFVFSATKNGKAVTIYTEPCDDEQEFLIVNEVIIQNDKGGNK